MTRPPTIDQEIATQWAEMAHLHVLDALMAVTSWTAKDVAFHGGTSLHLSWRSPRYSEDLDFLLSRDVSGDLDAIMRKVATSVQERFVRLDPAIRIDIRSKTKNGERMPVYQMIVTHPERTGKVMVKVEFWRVDKAYLQNYPTVFRTPLASGDMVSNVSHAAPAATLETAFCDKLTAFATRPHLKWRDIFDLWWIGTQTAAPLAVEPLAEQFLHNVSAYDTVGGRPPAEVFRDFLARDANAVISAAERDLKRWLPASVWSALQPDGPRQMVDYARQALSVMADYLENAEVPEDPQILKFQP